MTPRYRILAVDDNTDTLEIIQYTLKDDYDVLTLSNPMETFYCLDLFEPDLLILDIMMPKVTGFHLIDLLQKNPNTRDIPIIILSAKDNAREIKYGYKLGASLYLTKPFQPERLLKNVQTQFQLKPPAPSNKTWTLEQVQLRTEAYLAGKSDQPIALTSSLLTLGNVIKQSRKDNEAPRTSSGSPGYGRTAASNPPSEGSGPAWED